MYKRGAKAMEAIVKALQYFGYEKAAIIALLLGLFIDVNPSIKLNPIKAIFNYIGNAFNAGMKTEINTMRTDLGEQIHEIKEEQISQKHVLDEIIEENKRSEVENMRWEIIDFASSVHNEIKHSRSHYRHILKSISTYNNLINELGPSADDNYLQVQEAGYKIESHYQKYVNTNAEYF